MPFEEDKPLFTYTTIVKGKFVVRAKDEDNNDQIVERVNAEGKKVREYHYRSLKDVLLADIRVSKHETYGKSWEFILIDGNQYILWRQSIKGALGSNFLKMVEGIKLDQPFTLVPGFDTEKERSQIFVTQDGQWLKSNYPKPKEGETSECPPGKKIKVNDEVVWDYSDQNRFLWEKVVQSLRPFLPGVNPEMQKQAQAHGGHMPDEEQETIKPDPKPEQTKTVKQGSYQPPDDDTDDLPF